MVFTLVSAVQERLTDLVETAERERVEEIERKEKEKHAEEQASVCSSPGLYAG